MSRQRYQEGLRMQTLTQASSARSISAMGRRRQRELELPEHVHKVRARGKIYWYWQRGRGRPSDQRGQRHRIHGDPYAPAGSAQHSAFWAEIARLATAEVVYPTGTIGALVVLYRADDAYTHLAPATKASYDVHLNRFSKPDAWGMLGTNTLTPMAVAAGRDALADTPVMANQMLAVGRGIYDWAIARGLAAIGNPFSTINPIALNERGHIPWPRWAVDYVLQHAPDDLARLVQLGVATCQRESDLVRLGPQHREGRPAGGQGIWCRPKKTRRRRRAVFIPLAVADALELDRWATKPITFTATRWKKPIERHRSDLYLYSPRGEPYTPTSLRARYGRWLDGEAGRELCKRWREWLAEMVTKLEWDIDPEEKRGPTIHGLRGTGILMRFADGYDTDQIANDIGASRQTITHYMRYRDQMQVAVAGRERLRLVDNAGAKGV
jgi:hypothetical protein